MSVNARVINDVSTTADGRVGVLTREGASNRRNGIVFLDTSEPSHPRVVSEFTDTVTGGVHSAFVDGHFRTTGRCNPKSRITCGPSPAKGAS